MLDSPTVNYANTSPRGLTLWCGKKLKTVPITNPVMKVRLHRYKNYKQIKCSIYVVLEDEVLDLCAGLATYSRPRDDWHVATLNLHVMIKPLQTNGKTEVEGSREATLLHSVMALRCAASVKVEGATPELADDFSFRLSRPQYRNQLASQAVTALFSAGDNAFNIGHHTAALGYYYRASDYYDYCVGERPHLMDNGDRIVFAFKLGQMCARSRLEMHDFRTVYDQMNATIFIATGDFLVHPNPLSSTTSTPDFHVIEEEDSAEEDQRISKCKRFKEVAVQFKQRITCEDIGRCYMYRSIAVRCLSDVNQSSAAEDRLMSLACCGDGVTLSDGCIDELLELERRMMEHFIPEIS
ncbi:MAG: hypothetical protein HETSPECPRED_007331 [Heterodermia speciosa]|uniref:Uncharacterized protein n=1 Tax=Heterodermia speciosa TaxID=116794 RepID=A0A8H3FR73_9LECA|nr:MAG: hypothetical protein HETSPECPRED_007331 [Heterodermia speciosa]